jgi:hypothetical protein
MIFFLFATLSCQNKQKKTLKIENSKVLDRISAGSGLCKTTDGLWLIGDDTPFLYLINQEGQIKEKYRISAIPSIGQANYSKKIKPDFESIDVFNDTLIILGSGSQAYTRDTLVVFDSKNKKILLRRSVHLLYEAFYQAGHFPEGNQINLEGLANDGHYFYFFHRGNVCGNNRFFRVPKNEFINYLFHPEVAIPKISTKAFELPSIGSNKSGFSGASYSAKEKAIFVSISIEETSDVYHDGTVLGSFLGKISFQNYMPTTFEYWPIKSKSKEFLKTKIESICPLINSEKEIYLKAVSDNDNGKTGFYAFLLR